MMPPGMADVILTIWLCLGPNRCDVHEQVYNGNPVGCMRHGQAHAAKLIEQYPRRYVKRWTCRRPRA